MQGNVYQYGLAQFNNYTFQAPFTSTRLMLDTKPSLFTWRDVSAYFIGGIGMAWNEISYDEFAAIGIPQNSALALSNHTSIQLAWDIGAGIRLKLMEHLSATAEYVYAFLGNGSPKNDPNGINLTESPRFSFQTQSLLLGLSLSF
jgi:opacity protein-like surface antigen